MTSNGLSVTFSRKLDPSELENPVFRRLPVRAQMAASLWSRLSERQRYLRAITQKTGSPTRR